MSYTAWSVSFGETPSASKWNILGTNDASFNDGTGIADLALNTTALSNPYKFRAYRNTAWTTSNTLAKVAFDSENFDTNNNFDPVTNNRYTAPISGFYLFSACIGYDTSNGGINQNNCVLYKNGTAVSNFPVGATPAVSTTEYAGGSSILQLSASDYIEVYFTNSFATGGRTGSDKTWFAGCLICKT